MSHKSKQSSFLLSPYTIGATAIRCACVFKLLFPTEWLPWIHSRALQSALVDGIFTLRHVHEAAAIRQLIVPHSFVTAYKSGSIHLPPLLLAFFQPILQISEAWQHITLGLCLIAVDLFIAWTLERLGRVLLQQRKTKWEDELQDKVPEAIRPKLAHVFQVTKENKAAIITSENIPLLMAQLYYWSPITVVASNVFMSFHNLPVLFATVALLNASQGSLVWSSLSLVLACYINVHHAIFLVPSVILIHERRKSVPVFLFSFVVLVVAFQALAVYLVGESNYLSVVTATHGWTFQIQGIEPSLSTMWYVGMEMFDRFSIYFTILIGGAPYLLVSPLWIRLYRYPEAMVRGHCFWLA